MKTAIVYYSYTGNTKKVADVLAENLKEKGQVDLFKLEPLDESKRFLHQIGRALFKRRARLKEINFNLSSYDLICFGTPVWAFAPAPAMNTYLDRCFGLENKDVILFVTYGGGPGKERCLNYMQNILTKKGVKSFKKFSIQQGKDKEFILQISQLFYNYKGRGDGERTIVSERHGGGI